MTIPTETTELPSTLVKRWRDEAAAMEKRAGELSYGHPVIANDYEKKAEQKRRCADDLESALTKAEAVGQRRAGITAEWVKGYLASDTAPENLQAIDDAFGEWAALHPPAVPVESLGRDADMLLVPRLPTPEMMRAGEAERALYVGNRNPATTWAAMIGASPPAAPIASVPDGWLPIEDAPKDRLIDVWITNEPVFGRKWGEQPEYWAYCYYDQICGEWRTTRPSGHLRCVPERYVTHYRVTLPPTNQEGAAP